MRKEVKKEKPKVDLECASAQPSFSSILVQAIMTKCKKQAGLSRATLEINFWLFLFNFFPHFLLASLHLFLFLLSFFPFSPLSYFPFSSSFFLFSFFPSFLLTFYPSFLLSFFPSGLTFQLWRGFFKRLLRYKQFPIHTVGWVVQSENNATSWPI